MRVALIGCGFFARNHLNAWRDLRAEGVELAAVCDQDLEKARSAAQQFGVEGVYADAATMLDATAPDAVDIATQMASHLSLTTLAAERKINVIVQKPLAPDIAEAAAIVDTARKAGVRLAVHENFRFQAPIRKLKGVLDSGVIGAPTWARLAFRTGYDVYANQPYFHREKRLAILDVGIHVLDVARYLFGEAERVSCETQRRNAKNIGEDTATMMLRHASGLVSLVECTYEAKIDPDPFPETLISIEGERGSLALGRGGDATLYQVGGPPRRLDFRTDLLPWTEQPWHVVQESVLLTQRAIVGAWREGREAETSGEDNLKTFALVEAAYEAAAEARAVVPAFR